MHILPRLLRSMIHTGSLTLIDPDGASETFGGTNPGPAVTIRVTDPALDTKLVLNPELRFAEAYMDGGLEVAPEELRELFHLLKLNKKRLNRSPSQAVIRRAARLLKRIARNTPLRSRRNAAARDPERARAKMIASIPLRRLAQPQEVAASVVHLLSPAASFITGSELVIDGGLVAG